MSAPTLATLNTSAQLNTFVKDRKHHKLITLSCGKSEVVYITGWSSMD